MMSGLVLCGLIGEGRKNMFTSVRIMHVIKEFSEIVCHDLRFVRCRC